MLHQVFAWNSSLYFSAGLRPSVAASYSCLLPYQLRFWRSQDMLMWHLYRKQSFKDCIKRSIVQLEYQPVVWKYSRSSCLSRLSSPVTTSQMDTTDDCSSAMACVLMSAALHSITMCTHSGITRLRNITFHCLSLCNYGKLLTAFNT